VIDELFERRGEVAFVVVSLLIAVLWLALDRAPAETNEVEAGTPGTTTAPTTTTVAPELTLDAICASAQTYRDDAESLGDSPNFGEISELALAFWETVVPSLDPELRIEVDATIDHYAELIAVAEPHGYDEVATLTDGEAERFELLITSPANGLADGEAFIAELCEVDLPEQPLLTATQFRSFERQVPD